MKQLFFVLAFATLSLLAGHTNAQTMIMRGDGKGKFTTTMDGEAFILKELGAAISADNGAIKVLNVMPPERRPAAYRDVDLQQDDVIAMANGKRLAGVKNLQSMYDDLAVGDELKLGIKRNDEMRLVALKKGDPKDLPQLKMRIMQGGDDNTEMFPAVGVAMKMKGKDIVIDELLPGETAVQNADVKAGDVVVSLNGKEFKSLKEYSSAFDDVAPGKNVTWVLSRGGNQHTVSFIRPQPRMMMMKQEGKTK